MSFLKVQNDNAPINYRETLAQTAFLTESATDRVYLTIVRIRALEFLKLEGE
jgi:hypothetical protein